VAKTRYVHEGQVYHSVGAAAKMLPTNTAKVKQLMGDGSLVWLNLRLNGRLVIPESSILAYQRLLHIQKRVAAKE
jgi:hypothetical protein